MRSAAIFDVDGTLLRGFIIRSFPGYLADHGVIDKGLSGSIDEVFRSYEMGAVDYRYAAETVPAIYAEAIEGVKESTVKRHAQDYMRAHVPSSIHPYTAELIERVREKVDLIIALSGSPAEPIRYMAALGFHQTHGSVFEVKDGVYTGEITWNLILGERKAQYTREMAKANGIDLNRTMSFGDSDQDAQTLGLTALPIALNPSGAMRELCEARGWRAYTSETINIPEIVGLAAAL
jgi:putative phosphoserine phosphatase/1-acylglycerol-3-phosphate O-acyltransferase